MTRVGWIAATAAVAFAAISIGAAARNDRTVANEPTGLDGQTLFLTKGCAGCHSGPDTTSMLGASFPSLTDAPEWAGERRPGMSARDYLGESIRDPAAFFSPEFHGSSGPVSGMPQLQLSEAEIDALVEYLVAGD